MGRPSMNQGLAFDLGNESTFNKSKHVLYWKRCLKTFLPQPYTSNDSNRMLLAFFIISALDLLGAWNDTSAEEKEGYVQWIYNCQHPEGGFRGFPGTDLGEQTTTENKVWDPANLPATYLAIASLLVLGDDLTRMKRKECLQWLNKLQRPDGSFGETLGENGKVEGGMDTRFGYSAAVVRWMLRGWTSGNVLDVPDIRVLQLVDCIHTSQSYDGGISEAPFHESHAGLTYCAISALYYLDHLPPKSFRGLAEPERTIHWLVSRQTMTLDEEDEFDTNNDETDTPETCHDAHSFVKLRSYPSTQGELSAAGQPTSHFHTQWAGFNGRSNKIADTCYAFWAGGALAVLGKFDLIDKSAARRYLLDKTQHIIGGFGKLAGDPPDIFHSYMGLAFLAINGKDGLKSFSPALCASQDTVRHLESLPWRQDIVNSNTTL
ncbi:geranylgeranyl transferase type I beta subunit [Pseudovirgaria hyperparasitica]|uniref:Geranylgeranyl transferase type I beta subunit n=1 Tax=Pseudovirgaria hyperparasitica TaxID=470096 RepID=A0A6A6W685_9PEZI|nr:geranylgeranyl transferase type I beta subunit [Pseudovirgaria hyperparasitica]KAF2757067.1 geranylgeranyl transferase type I beta subunit [Pseudovirgaria hyperparasitica]